MTSTAICEWSAIASNTGIDTLANSMINGNSVHPSTIPALTTAAHDLLQIVTVGLGSPSGVKSLPARSARCVLPFYLAARV